MDGVIYDSMTHHAQSWTKAMESIGIIYPAYKSYLNEGRTSSGTIRLAYRNAFGAEAPEEIVQQVYHLKSTLMNQLPPARIFEGIEALIANLKKSNLKIMVVTGSKQAILIQRLTEDLGLESSNIISGQDVKNEKPHPEPYLMALEKSKTKPEEAIVIENAPLGIRSAKAAGLFTVAVNTGILEDELLSEAGANIVLPGTLHLLKKWDSVISYYQQTN